MNEIRVSLCPQCDACPEVVITDDAVTIGEEGNQVRLSLGEWGVLVASVKNGTLEQPAREPAETCSCTCGCECCG